MELTDEQIKELMAISNLAMLMLKLKSEEKDLMSQILGTLEAEGSCQ